MNKEPFKQLTAYTDETPVVASNSSLIMKEQSNKSAEEVFDAVINSYNKGVQWAIPKCQPEWVPVTERLPEIGSRVLCIDNHDFVEIGCFRINHSHGANKPIFMDEQDEQPSQLNPTHWMPLPQPPMK